MPCVIVARMGVLEMRYGFEEREREREREEDGTNIKSSSER